MHVFTTLGTAVAHASSSNACCFMQIVALHRQLCSVFSAFPFPYAMHTAGLFDHRCASPPTVTASWC
jgi:hypothetical protein